jgi:hypothetical protein
VFQRHTRAWGARRSPHGGTSPFFLLKGAFFQGSVTHAVNDVGGAVATYGVVSLPPRVTRLGPDEAAAGLGGERRGRVHG